MKQVASSNYLLAEMAKARRKMAVLQDRIEHERSMGREALALALELQLRTEQISCGYLENAISEDA